MMEEQFKEIKGYEGFYEISDLGNVRSVDRYYIQLSSHGTEMKKFYKGKLIKPFDNGYGYLLVLLAKPGEKRKARYVHRLVAEAFVENPNVFQEVNHKDYNKKNNSANNLEWVSRIENVHYSKANMEKPKPNAKMPETGERYITKKNGQYRLNIQRKEIRIDKLYRTLSEAVAARAVIIGG